MIDSLLAGLLTRSVYEAGAEAFRSSKILAKGPNPLRAVGTFLSEYTVMERISIDSQIPESASRDSIEALLKDPDLAALTQELIYAHLLHLPDKEIQTIEDGFLNLASQHLGNSVTQISNQIFEEINRECVNLMAKAESSDAEIHSGITMFAAMSSITATVRQIERHLASIANRSEADVQRFTLFSAGYREKLLSQHGVIVLPDFEIERHIPVDELYVEPTFTLGKERHASTLQAIQPISRIVILGDPGAGKSTLANVITFEAAKDPNRTPFLIASREYENDLQAGASILQHIEKVLNSKYQSRVPPDWVESLLLSGQATVIIDGLDELVKTSRRRAIRDSIAAFCQEYPLANIVVTSRTIGYDQAPLPEEFFEKGILQSFDESGVLRYASNWFKHSLARLPSEELDRRVANFLRESASVSDLRTNPLMLALMCVLYRGNNYIPESRLSLYEECAKLLFIKWDRLREIKIELEIGSDIENALMHIAYWMMDGSLASTGVSEIELVRQVSLFLQGRSFERASDADSAAEEFVKYCRGRAWVLAAAGANAEDQTLYTFAHRTFLEYYTARQVCRLAGTPEEVARKLAPLLAEIEWDVVGQLAVQLADKMFDGGADRLLGELLKWAEESSIAERHAILTFVASSTHYANPWPSTVREIVRSGWQMLSGDVESVGLRKSLGHPLRRAMGSAPRLRQYVADELRTCFLASLYAPSASTDDRSLTARRYALCALSPSLSQTYGAQNEGLTDYWQNWLADFHGKLEWRASYFDEIGLAALGALELGEIRPWEYINRYGAQLLIDGPEDAALGFSRIGTFGLLIGWLRGYFSAHLLGTSVVDRLLAQFSEDFPENFQGFDCEVPIYSYFDPPLRTSRLDQVDGRNLGSVALLLCMNAESRIAEKIEDAAHEHVELTTTPHRVLTLVDSLVTIRLAGIRGENVGEEPDRGYLDLFSPATVRILERWAANEFSFWTSNPDAVEA